MKKAKWFVMAVAAFGLFLITGCGSSSGGHNQPIPPDYTVFQGPILYPGAPYLNPAGNLSADVLALGFLAGEETVAIQMIELTTHSSADWNPILEVFLYDGPVLLGWGYFLKEQNARSAIGFYRPMVIPAGTVKMVQVKARFRQLVFFDNKLETVSVDYVGSAGFNMDTGEYIQDETLINGPIITLMKD